MTDDLTRLSRAAAHATRWTAERDQLIATCRDAGASWRQLAAASGLSVSGVKRAYDRRER